MTHGCRVPGPGWYIVAKVVSTKTGRAGSKMIAGPLGSEEAARAETLLLSVSPSFREQVFDLADAHGIDFSLDVREVTPDSGPGPAQLRRMRSRSTASRGSASSRRSAARSPRNASY
jgi:hypothetical protein